jgi:hypothetical protein
MEDSAATDCLRQIMLSRKYRLNLKSGVNFQATLKQNGAERIA